jgi:hypothetical protein
MSNTAKETTQPTKTLTWREARFWAEVERRVLRYQTRIYKATKDKKKEKVRHAISPFGTNWQKRSYLSQNNF